MDDETPESAGDRTEQERRRNLKEGEVDDLELAGGVEGGMQAGSAGGPSGSGGKKGSNRDSQPRER
jgi:hypothetical protein